MNFKNKNDLSNALLILYIYADVLAFEIDPCNIFPLNLFMLEDDIRCLRGLLKLEEHPCSVF